MPTVQTVKARAANFYKKYAAYAQKKDLRSKINKSIIIWELNLAFNFLFFKQLKPLLRTG